MKKRFGLDLQRIVLVLVSVLALLVLANSVSAQCGYPNTSVTNVKYLGKFDTANGKVDRVQVYWNTTIAPCVLVQSFEVTVIVDRGLRKDTGTAQVTGGVHSAVVNIQRGALQTDPKSYNVTIKQHNVGRHGAGIRISGVDASSLTGAQIVQFSPLNPGGEPLTAPAECLALTNFTNVSFTPHTSTSVENIRFTWTATGPTNCTMQIKEYIGKLTVTRPNGTQFVKPFHANGAGTGADFDTNSGFSSFGIQNWLFETTAFTEIVLPISNSVAFGNF